MMLIDDVEIESGGANIRSLSCLPACLGDELASPQDIEAFRVLQRNGRHGVALLPVQWGVTNS